MREVRLRNWSCCRLPVDPYMPPEMKSLHLQGDAYGHDNFEDGHGIVSSAVKEINGRRITTRSGTVYILEDADPGYEKFLLEHGQTLDNDNPIKEVTALSF